ncbi:hypothetical protein E4T47_02882 [Aureobasidium subglaciale]|nr:hypothetical protein E4T47_02882 [Aureobasidium subglaciale]
MLMHCCSAINMILIHFLFCLSVATNAIGQITKATSWAVQADPWRSQVGLPIQRREITSYCDSKDYAFCIEPAVCVYGNDGYIGCCTAIGAACSPRTECIDYTSGVEAPCDYITGECAYCSESALPFCQTKYRDGKHVFACGVQRLTTTITKTDINSAALSLFTQSLSPASVSATPTAASAHGTLSTETSSASAPQTSASTSAVSSAASPTSLFSLSTSTSTSKSTNAAAPEPTPSSSMASSRGLIIGVVIGAAAGSILLLVILFILWKYWKRRRSGVGRKFKEKPNKAGYSLGSGEDSTTEHTSSQYDVVEGTSSSQSPAELEEQPHRSNENISGIASIRSNHGHQPYSPEDIRGAAEAPSNNYAWSSPRMNHMTSPTPSNSSLWMTSPNMGTPRVPSQYVAYTPYTPSSVYSPSGQPPSSLPQPRDRIGNATQESPLVELEANEIGKAQ